MTAELRALARRARGSAVMLIDGHSGSGKTRLANLLAEELVREGSARPQIIGMDELYPGWDGLAAGSAALEGVLRSTTYLRYDWVASEFCERILIAEGAPLIVEGCGALTRESLAAARERGRAYGVWIECPEPLRKARALTRDGDMFAPHWESWARQERAHFARARPLSLSREIVHAG